MKAKLRIKDDRYEIYDVKLNGVICSMTFLEPEQETRGHSHPHEELYIFGSGTGLIDIDGERQIARPKMIIKILPGQFHRVINQNNQTLVFTCIWRVNK